MTAILYLTIILLVAYAVLIRYYHTHWKRIPLFEGNAGSTPATRVSVIIPARNEARNIGSCLNALAAQHYPPSLIEIIVVNDFSTDDTASVVRAFNAAEVRLIHLEDVVAGPLKAYKKKAVETGIAEARGDLIVTTDADCTAGPGWIATIVAFYEKTRAAFIAAPVRIEKGKGILSSFQSLDFLILQGITGASVSARFHQMCNGANLAYPRQVFFDVGGFQGIDDIASGDDMLLMQKIASRYPERIFFLKSKAALVDTAPQPDLPSFFSQRIRWASKAGHYRDFRIKGVLLLVYVFNVMLLLLFVAGFFNITWLFVFLLMLAAKAVAEWAFVSSVAGFFGMHRLLRYFFLFQPLHVLYMVMAGGFGMTGTYRWKGRRVK